VEADVAADVDAVEVAPEHHVEKGHIVGKAGTQRLDGLLAAQGHVDRHPGFRQPTGEAPCDLRLVLDNQYPHGGIVGSGRRRQHGRE
jgi:hypothetical protein